MKDVIFTSVAFGELYVPQLKRLKESIDLIYPENNFKFWVDELPPTAKPFLDSLYGFKVHAVRECLNEGFKKIVWFDPAIILNSKIDAWLEMVEDYGVLAVKDDNKLSGCTCDMALKYFGVTREQIDEMGQHLVGGSVYVFDFNLPLCREIFELWEQSERDGIFGTQVQASSEQIDGCRNDESCMAHSLYHFGSKPVPYDLMGYNNGEVPIVIKKHFK